MKQLIEKHGKVIFDSLSYYLGKLIPGLIGFFSVPLFIRLFGETVYGEYSILLSTLMLISTFSSGWIGHTFIRFYSEKKNKIKYSLFIYKIFISTNILISIILFSVLIYLDYNIYISIILMLVYLFLTIYSLLSLEIITKLLSRRFVLVDSIRSIIFLATVLAFYYQNKNIENTIIILFTGNLISYTFASFSLNFNFFKLETIKETFRTRFNNAQFKELTNFGLPIAAWMVTAYLLNISDRYVIKYFYSFDEVGVYSAIYDLFYKFITLAFSPLMVAIHPIIMKLYNEGDTIKAKFYIRWTIIIQIVAFIIFFIIVSFIKEIIIIDFLKINKLEAIKLVSPIIIGAFLWNISMIVHKPFELMKKTNVMFYGVLIAFGLNLIGNIIFIPKFGIIAAAYTTLFGTGSYLVYILIKLRNTKI